MLLLLIVFWFVVVCFVVVVAVVVWSLVVCFSCRAGALHHPRSQFAGGEFAVPEPLVQAIAGSQPVRPSGQSRTRLPERGVHVVRLAGPSLCSDDSVSAGVPALVVFAHTV